MKEKDETKLSRILYNLQGESTAKFPWGDAQLEIKYINYSSGGMGCPDSLLIVKISLPILGKNVTIQAPILIEAEKAGMNAALEDLEKFCNRSSIGALEGGASSFLEIPMLVATQNPKSNKKTISKSLTVSFQVNETKL